MSTPANNPPDSGTQQSNQPSPQPGTGNRSDSASGPKRAYPRWATASWWLIVVGAEIAALVMLAYMARGDRYPFVETYLSILSRTYLDPVTPSEIAGALILPCVLIALLILYGRWGSRVVLALGLAVTLAVVVFLFEWGMDRRLPLFDGTPPPLSPAWNEANDVCSEQYPTAVEGAFPRGRGTR